MLQTDALAPRLGYLLRTFPVLSETFVANEIRTVAGLTGQTPVVAALHRPGPGQAGSIQTIGPAALRYWPDIDKGRMWEIAGSLGKLLGRSPLRAWGALTRPGPEGLRLRDRVKAANLALFFLDRGVGHLHSHFGWEQADMLAFLRRLTGLPYSLTLHAADIFAAETGLGRRLGGAVFVATVSEYNRRKLIQRFGNLDAKIHVVRCGVDIESLRFSPAPRTFPVRLVSVGRLVAKKGFDVLLKAIAQLRDERLTVAVDLVGDGPLREELQRLSWDLGLDGQVRFHGALPPDRTVETIRKGQIFALACQVAPDGDMDGIPVALMEAMALGRPVVSTRLSGIPELLAGGCGLLARPGDFRSLAARLRLLAMEDGLAPVLAARARARIEKEYTLEVQARRIMELAASGRNGHAA